MFKDTIFKGFAALKNDWIYGDLKILKNGAYMIHCSVDSESQFVPSKSVGMYIGIRSNDTLEKIFSGDQVLFKPPGNIFDPDPDWVFATIEYIEDLDSFGLVCSHGDIPIHGDIKIKIVGNSFEQEQKFAKELSRLQSLRSWTDNWDGFGSRKPSDENIDIAETFLGEIHGIIKEYHLKSRSISFSGDEDGLVVFEIWNEDRKLTFDICKNSIEYTTLEGSFPPVVEQGVYSELSVKERIYLIKWICKQVE